MPRLDAIFLTRFSISGLTEALPVAILDTVDTLTSAARARSESVVAFFFISVSPGSTKGPYDERHK
jgi:hypothetical protein